MALVIRGKTQCAICGKTIEQEDSIVMCPHFIADQSDPLWRFSDAAFHQFCFINWELKGSFVAKFNQVARPYAFGNSKYNFMRDDGVIEQRPAGD